ncbi:MAG: discoidin domain-containing protein [Candidatus Aureabacteria bacterium]|nr:discoidin domain-containing protein [Candidatus Auribacterota bacterium]
MNKTYRHIIFPLTVFFMWTAHCFSADVYLMPSDAKVSSFDKTPGWAPEADAGALIDADLSTRWASDAEENNSWVIIDLGKDKYISSVVINWERAFALKYNVCISPDGETWEEVGQAEKSSGGREKIEFKPQKSRFVKIGSLEKINENWGVSIWEVEIYGSEESNPDEKPLAEIYPEFEKAIHLSEHLEKEDPVSSPGELAAADFQKGVAYTSYHNVELLGADSDKIIEYLRSLDVTDISLVITWYQEEQDSASIKPMYVGGNSARDEAVIHAVNQIHKNGMRVMLKPHVDCINGTFRGDIIPGDEWFESYLAFIMHFASIAREYNVECFCIGTELEATTYEEYDQHWNNLIKEVRAVFNGKITYAANWSEYKGVLFWDKLDFMGIDAYFPLTGEKDPSQDDLDSAWESVKEEIKEYRDENNISIPLIFTEVGYQSADGTNKTPWYTSSEKEDQEEQAMCFKAMLNAMLKEQWFKGFYWWNYFPAEVFRPLDFTINGKIAEGVLKDLNRENGQ